MHSGLPCPALPCLPIPSDRHVTLILMLSLLFLLLDVCPLPHKKTGRNVSWNSLRVFFFLIRPVNEWFCCEKQHETKQRRRKEGNQNKNRTAMPVRRHAKVRCDAMPRQHLPLLFIPLQKKGNICDLHNENSQQSLQSFPPLDTSRISL